MLNVFIWHPSYYLLFAHKMLYCRLEQVQFCWVGGPWAMGHPLETANRRQLRNELRSKIGLNGCKLIRGNGGGS